MPSQCMCPYLCPSCLDWNQMTEEQQLMLRDLDIQPIFLDEQQQSARELLASGFTAAELDAFEASFRC